MYGNTGKIVRVDLSSGKIDIQSLPEAIYRKYIGGSGLAAAYFWEHGDPGADALNPAAMLIFMNGPFAGLRISGASRNCVAGRSPLTGTWGDASCGGWFAPALRYAGYDGIVITGQAASPVMLQISDDRIELQAADALWGMSVDDADRAIKADMGRYCRTVAIGPAGENRVRYANILNEAHHAFGRCGFGAIMGAKRLKAIAVNASKTRMTVADPEGYAQLKQTLKAQARDSITGQVLGDLGTAAKLEYQALCGDVPIRNWTSNIWEEMGEALTGDTLAETYLTGRRSCAFCRIACKRVVAVDDGPFAIPSGPGPEYETIAAFGALMGAKDLAAVCKAGRVCNQLGMDTISAGATIAWAMEAFERGDLTLADTEGIALQWGDMDTVVHTLLPKIARREGALGKLLAGGSVAAAKRIGRESLAYTAHSKGLEAPMHDPRGGGHGLALAYAVSPRGGCHVATIMLPMENGACYYPEIGFEVELEPLTDEHKAEAAQVAVEMGGIENSACFCQFADRELTIGQWVDLFNTVAGYGWDAQAMMRAGRRVFYLKRLLNSLFGLTAEDDVLPPRMLEPARDGEPEGIVMNFDVMKADFYHRMRIDPERGVPLREALEACGMAEEAGRVWPR
ncbi:MAG: aldehyde ferredoxin oxidoreductase family protein [Desulfobacterales bacterium]|nr:aldehyde ferredoxin oxidoreductase family protein [Desulfobacterales bacterium]